MPKTSKEHNDYLKIEIECPYCSFTNIVPIKFEHQVLRCDESDDHRYSFAIVARTVESVCFTVRKAEKVLYDTNLFTMIERKTFPRVYCGIDYGVESHVLIQIEGVKTCLVWTPGCMYWASRGSQSYGKASLCVMYKVGWTSASMPNTTLFEGRFSKPRVHEQAHEIVQLLGLSHSIPSEDAERIITQIVSGAKRNGCTFVAHPK